MSTPNAPTTDLHRHFYGSVRTADLYAWCIQSSGEGPASSRRWMMPLSDFARRAQMTDSDPPGFATFEGIYAFVESVSRFATEPRGIEDLPLIAEEIRYLVDKLAADQAREGLAHTETRMHLPTRYGEAFNLGLARAVLGRMASHNSLDHRMELVLTLPRAAPLEQWRVVEDLALGPLGELLVGLDLAGNEAVGTEAQLLALAREIRAFNAKNPHRALALLVHAGEQTHSRPPVSAIRAVHRACQAGADRIGHALALALPPSALMRATDPWRETVSQRLSQIDYELEFHDALAHEGVRVNAEAFAQERSRLMAMPSHATLLTHARPDPDELRARQRVAQRAVRTSGTVIECCPTSNLRIAGIDSLKDHPIHAFLSAGLTVVVATDNPGLLDTTLEGEHRALEPFLAPGVSAGLASNAVLARSTVLSGRTGSR
jgi:adenosine deaminase